MASMGAHGIRCLLLALGAGLIAGGASAHCDTLDGPVIAAARTALAGGTPDPVLIWVRESDEPEIRRAFGRALRVRASGGEAKGLADDWFFENLVRIHRAGEGEPFTGLKPAGLTSTALAAADRALVEGCAAPLALSIAPDRRDRLMETFEAARAARSFRPGDLKAGRAYVRAYVEYIHLVEEAFSGVAPDAHPGGRKPAHHPH